MSAHNERPEIRRVGFLLKVKQDRLEDYKLHHQNVWPEMLDALRRNGWRNYSLFARKDGLLFGYFEAEDDFAASLGGHVERGGEPALAGVHGRLFRDTGERPPGPDDARA